MGSAESSVIRGSVDGFEGSYLTGWAIALPADRNCTIQILDEAGRALGANRAARPRPDLAALGFGRTNFAFRIPVGDLGSSRSLRVLADGVELPGSPVPVGPRLFDGAFALANGTAHGWVMERRQGSEPPMVRLVDQDGRTVVETRASVDPAPGDPRFAPGRFLAALPDECYGAAELRLRAFADGVEFASASCSLRLEGYLDGVWPDRCAGWLVSPDAPGKRFEIEVVRDGRVVGAGACDAARPDLRERFPDSWQVGFDIPLSLPDTALARAADLSVRLAGTGVELFGGPFVVGRRAALVAAARGVARLAHGRSPRLGAAERAVLQAAVGQYAEGLRQTGGDYVLLRRAGGAAPRGAAASPAAAGPRMSVVIPVYKGVEVTRACVESVLAHRDPARDAVVLVNDRSPDPGMAPMLAGFAGLPNLHVLHNEANLGFVRSVNRALGFCRTGDVVLLNSDTRVFAGGLEELWRVARAHSDVGTVTALSNNATIFSYPHPALAGAELEDMAWADVAAAALREGAGSAVDVPTGHGFCMLVKREVLDRVPLLNEQFGRGYGEENELCLRAADLGYRHVCAAGAFVEHRESVSFGTDKEALLKANLPVLERMFPEYTPTIMDFQERDGLRRARWALDAERLRRASGTTGFALVLQNRLGGGTRKAIADLEGAVGYGGAVALRLTCGEDGMTLECERPAVRAVFSHDEADALVELLGAARVELVMVHQLLGLSSGAIRALTGYVEGKRSVCYLHDFFAVCPRVTMLDAVGQFCGVGDDDRCGRCVALGGVHEASRLSDLRPSEHRALLRGFLAAVERVVAPSADTAAYVARVMPEIRVAAVPHPDTGPAFPDAVRPGGYDDIVLLGAIGPHKGSARLLALARQARLSHPHLRFHVVGYTDIDRELKAVGNVSVTGAYEERELPDLVRHTGGRIALFLHGWPETFSYTLTEAARLGLFPMVPDIGAPAERVRAAGFGAVFGFPIEPGEVLARLAEMKERRALEGLSPRPAAFADPRRPEEIAEALGLAEAVPA